MAKELWFRGLPPAAIELQTGIKAVTIRKRASREQWGLQKRPDTAVATSTKTVVTQEIADRLAKDVVEQAEALLWTLRDLAKPVNYREAKDYATALSATYATARKSLGLDDDNSIRNVSVTLINARVDERPVIDVTPEPIGAPTNADAALPNAVPPVDSTAS